MSTRVILLVLDGLGVGAMQDSSEIRPQDKGANTLRSILKNTSDLKINTLLELGLGHVMAMKAKELHALVPLASYGRCRLAHHGADSYLGHQEIMGTIPQRSKPILMVQVVDRLEEQLTLQGHSVKRPMTGKCLLLVDEAVVIGDNLEADPGLNINLTVATDLINFDDSLKIGKIVRELVPVSRVIVFGGPGIRTSDILDHVDNLENGQIGIHSPSLGIYNENLCVRHLGYGVDSGQQAATIIRKMGIPVFLIGKMADVIDCEKAIKNSMVPTVKIMEHIAQLLIEVKEGLIAATIQETDLAAHEGDFLKLASVIEQFDLGLSDLISDLSEEDIVIICADHGNDPSVNVGLHTREETPLLIYQKGQPATSLGVRNTLADIGATVTDIFGAPATKDGSIINFRRNLCN